MPKVSVVLPTYNGEKYIKQSIDSILSQTFSDLELIIVNDCSMDHTPDIISEYAGKDPRVRIINNTVNQKLPNSLNIGFAEAAGDYLTWTSDDNLYLPDAIKIMYEKLLSSEDIYMVCADMDYIDFQGNITGRAGEYDDNTICILNYIGACFMYKRVIYDKIGGYRPDLYYVEDYDYWLRIREEFGRIMRIDEMLYRYRQHDESISSRKKTEVLSQLLKLRKIHINFILEQFKDNKTTICQIYYEFIEKKIDVSDIQCKIAEYVPEILFEIKEPDKTKEYVIFGAGKVGEAAANLLGNRAVCFADNDPKKVGESKGGLKIISFQELNEKKYADCLIVISIPYSYIYELIHQLVENGFKEYCTYYVLAQMKHIADAKLEEGGDNGK